MIYFQVFFAVFVWGSSFVFTKILVHEISPLSIVTFRALIGIVTLIFLTKSDIKPADLKFGNIYKIFILAVLGVGLQQYIQAYSLIYTEANHAGWLIATTPIIVAVLSVIFGERIGLSKTIAFALGFIGTILVVFSKSSLINLSLLPSTKGDLIFLISALTWAWYVIGVNRWFKKSKQTKITTITMLVAMLSLLPIWLVSGRFYEIYNISMKGFFCLAYLGILSSGFGYMFWNNGVEKLGPVKTSYFLYLEPFATLITSYIFLGEDISLTVISGGILILFGVYIINPVRKFKPEPPTDVQVV